VKNKFVLLLVISLSFLLINCNRDAIVIEDTSQNFFPLKQFRVVTNHGSKVSPDIVSYLKIRSGNNLRVNINKYSISLSNSTTTKNESQNIAIGTILTGKEVVVTNEYNTKHTFEVLTPSEPNSKTNLIVIETDTYIDEYFLKYIANENSTSELFSGIIESYNSNGDLIGSAIVESGDINTVSGRLNPDCADQDDPDSTDNNTNSNTNNSGGDSSVPPNNNGVSDDTPGNTNQTSSNGGELTDSGEPCNLGYYYACNRGYTDYHLPRGNPKCSGNDMSGDNLIITDCNGIYAAKSNAVSIDPCIGAAGVILIYNSIFDINGLNNNQIDWLNENPDIADELQNLLSDNNFTQEAEDFILEAIEVLMIDQNISLEEYINTQIDFISPDIPIEDIEDYLSCFDTTQSAEITIYVNQPVPNSDEVYVTSGDTKAGHSSIGISQGNVNRTWGLYPEGNVSPIAPNDPFEFGNDSGREFHVSITFSISPSDLQRIINDAEAYNQNYDLNNNNCTDYVIQVAQSIDRILPDPQATWPANGGGSCPGPFGQALRTMILPAGTTRNNDGGDIMANTGDCN